MPILTMSVIFLPVAPRALPERTASANADMALKHLMNLGHDIIAIDGEALAVRRPQRDMQHGAVLGDVDLVAGEHRVAPAFDVGCLGQPSEQRHRFTRHRAFRPVEQEAAGR